jgi:hypothetical protein
MKRRPWTAAENRLLRKMYPNTQTKKIARKLRRKVGPVYQHAILLGLRKSAKYLASPAAGRLDGIRGSAHRFPKGNVPWNKGTHWTAGGRSKLTRFKKGQMPHNWHPVGRERVTKDGILQRKVKDTGYTPSDYKGVHAIVYEEHFGKIQKGHIVVFRDRNRRNFAPENLECISRVENMKRNTYHRYPKEIARLIQLRGALNRQINRRESKHGK